jgi:hypothetical protein
MPMHGVPQSMTNSDSQQFAWQLDVPAALTECEKQTENLVANSTASAALKSKKA